MVSAARETSGDEPTYVFGPLARTCAQGDGGESKLEVTWMRMYSHTPLA